MRTPPARTAKRLLWFVALWAGGVVSIATVAILIKLALGV